MVSRPSSPRRSARPVATARIGAPPAWQQLDPAELCAMAEDDLDAFEQEWARRDRLDDHAPRRDMESRRA